MKPDPSSLIFSGLMKVMPPTQAIVMMAIINQHPLRATKERDWYFKPNEREILRQMRIKPAVFYELLRRLVEARYLKKARARGDGFEYRINFDLLRPFLKAPASGTR